MKIAARTPEKENQNKFHHDEDDIYKDYTIKQKDALNFITQSIEEEKLEVRDIFTENEQIRDEDTLSRCSITNQDLDDSCMAMAYTDSKFIDDEMLIISEDLDASSAMDLKQRRRRYDKKR